jgi:hypothetical protein
MNEAKQQMNKFKAEKDRINEEGMSKLNKNGRLTK